MLTRLLGHPMIPRAQFNDWARGNPGVDTVRHYHALRACWPFLMRGPQNFLNIGAEPTPWLRTVGHFAGAGHRLFGCRQNAIGDQPVSDGPFPVDDIELDTWSPLARKGLPSNIPYSNLSIITAVGLVDHLYHPEPFFKAVSEALQPGGVLILTVRNVGSMQNVLRLLNGDGLMPDLDAVAGLTPGPRPWIRQYAWRELAMVALYHHMYPVRHEFFGVDAPAEAGPPTSADGQSLDDAVCPILARPDQLRPYFFLVLRRARGLPVHRFSSYMMRHATRSTLRYTRDRIARKLRCGMAI